MKKTLIIDIDGVVCQYDFPNILKKHFGISVPNDWICHYSIEDSLGIPTDEVHEMFEKEVYSAPNIILGAVEALKRFIIKDYYVDIFSNRLSFMVVGELEDWLNQYGIPFSQVLTWEDLPSYAHAAIDDSPSKLLKIDKEVSLGKMILFLQPWNQSCHDILNKFRWVENWKQVVEEVNGG
jgi:hypothetical protein